MKLRIKPDVVVDGDYLLQPMHTCPKGRKVLLKVFLGGTVTGIYAGEDSYTGWAPLPKEPEWLKDLERSMFERMKEKRNEP